MSRGKLGKIIYKLEKKLSSPKSKCYTNVEQTLFWFLKCNARTVLSAQANKEKTWRWGVCVGFGRVWVLSLGFF